MDEKIKIFISSVIEVLKNERKIVAEAIRGMSFATPILAEEVPADEDHVIDKCREIVQECHMYLGIFDRKWGEIPKKDNPKNSSITALEYYWAKEKDLPIFIFYSEINELDREKPLTEFLKSITDIDKGHWCKKYSNHLQLRELALSAIYSKIVEKVSKGDSETKRIPIEAIKGADSEKRKRDKIARDLLGEIIENREKVKLVSVNNLHTFDAHIWNEYRGEIDFLGSVAGTSLRNSYIAMKEQNNYLDSIKTARDTATQRAWESKYTAKEKLDYIKTQLDIAEKTVMEYVEASGDYTLL